MNESFIYIVTPWTSWLAAGIAFFGGMYVGYLITKVKNG